MSLAKYRYSKKKASGLKFFFNESGKVNVYGISFLVLSAVFIAIVVAKLGIIGGVLILGLTLGIPGIYASVAYPKFGIVMLFILSSTIFWIIRLAQSSLPLGTLIDAFQALLILGFFIKQKKHPHWEIYKNPITIIILIWIGYNLVQFVNPNAESRLAWVYTIRSVAMIMLMYFVFLYNLDSKKYIRILLKLWLGLAVVVGLYALKQETIGFFSFEEIELADENVRSLLFIAGHWRKFSIYSDPVAFGFNMAISAILCFGLILGPISKRKKILLGFMMMFFLIVMLFSGTRGAYVLFPAAMALFSIMHFNKNVFIFCLVGGSLFAFLVYVPTSNAYLYRFQTAFKPSEDNSFNVRKNNMARIKPYIQSHPLGGGLGATGVWGVRFAPNSFLANFPSDSGFLRSAVELGWIGLALICTLMFVILRAGVNSYFRIRDPELKNYCMCMTLVVFALNIGNYPQEALINYPTPFFFYLAAAIINSTYNLDKKQTEQKAIDTQPNLLT